MERRWVEFEEVSETDVDNEKLATIYQIEEDLIENYLIVDKFGLRDGEDMQEENEEDEEEEEEDLTALEEEDEEFDEEEDEEDEDEEDEDEE